MQNFVPIIRREAIENKGKGFVKLSLYFDYITTWTKKLHELRMCYTFDYPLAGRKSPA